jgi:hypothetical protein
MANTGSVKLDSKTPDEKCVCGKRISPLAKRLQDPNPGHKRKCFTCLVDDHEVKIVTL